MIILDCSIGDVFMKEIVQRRGKGENTKVPCNKLSNEKSTLGYNVLSNKVD